jgi:thioredoxin reductase (NADPH)
VSCHALLIATGVTYRRLDAPGIDRLTDAGVYYGAAITEALSCKDQDVFVVGGGNSAGQAAMYLSRYARSVNILVRGESLAASMSHYQNEQIQATPNISVCAHTRVAAVDGAARLEKLTLADTVGGQERTVPADALFIFIGAAPHTDWVANVVERDSHGFILTGPDAMRDGERPRGWWAQRDPFWLETTAPGIFVAGDVRHRSIKRVASAVGEGAMAVQLIHQHLATL